MHRIRLTVLVADDWHDRYPTVVAECRDVGMAIERELQAIGVIVGTLDEQRMQALQCIDGVSSVEPERRVQTQGGGPEAGGSA